MLLSTIKRLWLFDQTNFTTPTNSTRDTELQVNVFFSSCRKRSRLVKTGPFVGTPNR